MSLDWWKDSLSTFTQTIGMQGHVPGNGKVENFYLGDKDDFILDLENIDDTGVKVSVFRNIGSVDICKKIKSLLEQCDRDVFPPYNVKVGLKDNRENTLVLCAFLEKGKSREINKVLGHFLGMFERASI